MAIFQHSSLGDIDRDAAQRYAIAKAARHMNVPHAALAAVVHVESGGKSFAMVEGRAEPLIRFEGHYFYRLLPAALRGQAVAAGLAAPKAGAVANPRRQAARWAMLERARAIDRSAADQSVSWGIGQVMGANWRMLGYGSVGAMVADARSGFAGQLRVMTRFIVQHDLAGPLRSSDFAAFARVYNGPAYARHGYHTRMEAAFRRLSGAHSKQADRDWLGLGDFGPEVRQLQTELRASGEQLLSDGDFGPGTHRAVCRFQSRTGLVADGLAGPATRAALMQYLPVPDHGSGPESGPIARPIKRMQFWQRFQLHLGRALRG